MDALDWIFFAQSSGEPTPPRNLCAITHSHLPFGGKQVVFVGDLFQLPPVYRKGTADEDMLRAMYGDGTPYFYKANVMKRMNLPKIEFQKVYRQKDQPFLSILDRMRLGENIQEDFDIINEQVSADDKVGDYSVTLASLNETVDGINNSRLGELDKHGSILRKPGIVIIPGAAIV